MNEPHLSNQPRPTPPTRGRFLLLLIGLVAGIILTLAIFGIVSLVSRKPYIPSDLPTNVDVLPDDPDKTPIFSGATALSSLDRTAAKTADLDADVALLLDVSTGKVVASKNGQKKFYPASITKVMTLVVACERLSKEDLEEQVTITEELWLYAQSGGYKGTDAFRFDPGDRMTVRTLLFGVGVSSFSDCTIALVRKLASSEEEFVGWMNQKAQEMGLKSTHFDNVVGYESDENYSTAEDLAILMTYALQCDLIREILSSPSYAFTFGGYTKSGDWKDGINGTFFSTLFNANSKKRSRMLSYEESTGKKFSLAKGTLDGGKTGTLTAYSLASYATIDGKTYVSIVGDSPSSAGLMKDVKRLFDSYIE